MEKALKLAGGQYFAGGKVSFTPPSQFNIIPRRDTRMDVLLAPTSLHLPQYMIKETFELRSRSVSLVIFSQSYG